METGEWKPDDWKGKDDLAKKFSVSRTYVYKVLKFMREKPKYRRCVVMNNRLTRAEFGAFKDALLEMNGVR